MKQYKALFLSALFMSLSSRAVHSSEPLIMEVELQKDNVPQFLYKILSLKDWDASQADVAIKLAKNDERFIHLSKEDQLDRISQKYWANVSEYVVLKIDTTKLPGRLVYEANPGGTSKYYHLYNGSIPMNAIVESKKGRTKYTENNSRVGFWADVKALKIRLLRKGLVLDNTTPYAIDEF